MGYSTSTVHGIEVPDASEANDVPEDIGKVVTALEGGSLVKRLTSAQIAALTAPQKPAGLVVYNTTTNKLQRSNGTAFVDAALEPANNLSDLASASTARTNLGLGTAATTAATAYATAAQGTKADNALPANYAVGGVIVATTNGSGQVSVTLPTSPTGNWSVTASAPAQFILVSVSGTTATFTVYALSGSGPTYPLVLLASDPTPLRIFYHAIAY